MNEQFSRLYHLAWNYAESDPEYQEKLTYERRCVVQSRIFAELIVREVFAKIEDERFEIHQPVKESVMKHFGVEQ